MFFGAVSNIKSARIKDMDKKTMIMVGGGVVVLVVGIVIGSYYQGSKTEQLSPASVATSTTETPAVGGAARPITRTLPPVSAPLTRDEAYKYYSGKKLYTQLLDCVGYPMSFIFRSGTKMMVENQSNEVANLVVWDKVVTIPGNDFKIVTVDHSGVYDAMCNNKKSLRLQVSPQ